MKLLIERGINVLVNLSDDSFQGVKIWSFHRVLGPAFLDHVGELFRALVVVQVIQGRAEIWTLAVLNFSVNLCKYSQNILSEYQTILLVAGMLISALQSHLKPCIQTVKANLVSA